MTGRPLVRGFVFVLAVLCATCVVALILRGVNVISSDSAARGSRADVRNESPGNEIPQSSGRLVATGRKGPPAETAMTMCLREKGWEVVPFRGTTKGYLPGGPIPPEKQIGFLKAERHCSDSTDSGEQVEPEAGDLQRLYGEVISTKKCLEGEGYYVVETPSLAEFVEVRGKWDPYESLISPDMGYIGDGEYLRLYDLCQNPVPR